LNYSTIWLVSSRPTGIYCPVPLLLLTLILLRPYLLLSVSTCTAALLSLWCLWYTLFTLWYYFHWTFSGQSFCVLCFSGIFPISYFCGILGK